LTTQKPKVKKKKTTTTKREALLADSDVRSWYNNLAQGSPHTAEVRLRRLSIFCETNNFTPRTVVQLAKRRPRRFKKLLRDYVIRLQNAKKAPGYIIGILKSVRSWLSDNEVAMTRDVKVANAEATPTIENERVPEKEELRTILMSGNPRANSIIVLMAEAGLRPQTLGNKSATDGLRIRDLPELRIENGRADFTMTPTMVKVRSGSNLSKGGHAYFTFLPQEGCEFLAAYLNKRLSTGEQLTGDSPIIRVKEGFENKGRTGNSRGSQFVSTRNISREARQAIRAQFKWRPYVLRAYFDTQLLEAENHGKIVHAFAVFFMGHKGDIEARYTTNKGKLPDSLIKDMRTAFQNCEPYLVTSKREGMTEEGVIATFNRQYLQMSGYSDEEIDAMGDLSQLSAEEMQELIRKKSMAALGLNGKSKQKIVPMTEVRGWIIQGWEFVTALPSDEAVIRLPTLT
jgi:PAS domain-containing protein